MQHEIYNSIGLGYNSSRKADPYLTSRFFCLLEAEKGCVCLDLGCGTGNYTKALSAMGLKFIAVDPSEFMLNEARRGNGHIDWRLGSAEEIPAEDSAFSAAMAVLTLHHWSDRNQAFKEIYRVMAKSSRLVIFTSDPEQMKSYWLNHYFPQMMQRSIVQMPALETIRDMALQAGFEHVHTEPYFVSEELKDHFLYCGKNRPELYFDPRIRQGISSFSALANTAEVKSGLEKLKSDLADSSFDSIRKEYENVFGDYSFIVFRKN